jgi:hypothetical protein
VPRTWTETLVRPKQWKRDILGMLGASSLGTMFESFDPEDILNLQATRCENPRSRGEDSCRCLRQHDKEVTFATRKLSLHVQSYV